MDMLQLLLVAAKQASVPLSKNNSDSVFSNSRHLPVLIEVWDPWCPHCKQFADSWSRISSSKEFEDSVMFADIDCNFLKSICKMFPGSATPRFFWMEKPGSQLKQFSGQLSLPELYRFIQNQLSSPITAIPSAESLAEEVNRSLEYPFFLFNVSTSDENSKNMARSFAKEFSHLPIRFGLYEDQSKHYIQLSFVAPDTAIRFSGQFNSKAVGSFITSHSLPFLSYFTQNTMMYSEINSVPIAVFVYPDDLLTIPYDLKRVAEAIRPSLLVTQVNCKLNEYFCRYIGESSRRAPFLAIFDKSEGNFWKLRSPGDQKAVKIWLQKVLKHKIKSGGPGSSFASPILAAYYEARGRGGYSLYLLYLPLIASITCISMLIYFSLDACLYRRSQKQKAE